MRIILASASYSRRQIMSKLGIGYEIIPSEIEEAHDNEAKDFIEAITTDLAVKKARDVAIKVGRDALVIAADSLIFFGRKEIIGKPKNLDEARQMLEKLSANMHMIGTGLCTINTNTGRELCGYSSVYIWFRKLGNAQLDKYLSEYGNAVLQYAGAYDINVAATRFITKIKDDYTCLGGLPVHLLAEMLKENGVII